MLLDNHTTAMTGGQDHAGTGVTLRGEKVEKVDFEQLVRSVGVKWVRKTDSYNLGEMYQILREAIKFKGVSVLISDRPCVLDPMKIKGTPYQAFLDSCTGCQSCMNLGCPAIHWNEEMYDGHHKVTIDQAQCMGCSLCAQVCSENAIQLVTN